MSGGVLALDIATTTGFATATQDYLSRWQPRTVLEGPRPDLSGLHFGSRRMGDEGAGPGAVFDKMERWMHEMIDVHQPKLITAEAPLPTMKNMQTGKRLIGLYSIAVMVSHQRGRFFQEKNVGAVKKFATQHGKATKDDMKGAAYRMGWKVPDDNAADAGWCLELTLHEQWMKEHGHTSRPGEFLKDSLARRNGQSNGRLL